MSTREWCRLLGLELSPYTLRACAYLESKGLRFCVDFGYMNAVGMARDHWRKRKRRRK